ncbi:MAG: uracil-DNA glycosylase family protein [Caldilineales bacterium]
MDISLDAFQAQLAVCRRCLEQGFPIVPPPIFSSHRRAPMMIIGQAPGKTEQAVTRRPFSGPAGKRLFRWLAEAGWDEEEFRAANAMAAITRCYPGPHPAGRGDRVPGKVEQVLCSPWLEQELALAQPRTVVPVGGLAITRLLGVVKLSDAVGRAFARPADDAALTPWARQFLPATCRIVPLPHPSGASQWFNAPANQALISQALTWLAKESGE